LILKDGLIANMCKYQTLKKHNTSYVVLQNCLSKRACWHSVQLMLLKLTLYLPVFADAVVTWYQKCWEFPH